MRFLSRPVLLALCVSSGGCERPPGLPPGLGDRVPDTELRVVENTGSPYDVGDVVRLSRLEGKPVILDFWATWCTPCKAQHEFLDETKARFGDAVEVVGILFNDDPDNLAAWLERSTTAYPTTVEPDGTLTKRFMINGIPRMVLLTPERTLSWDMMGTWGLDSVTANLVQMLGAGEGVR